MHGHTLIDTWYRRLPRYLFIEDRLRGQVVVELGCGQGVGADFVAERGAARVHGFDFDERLVLKARGRYQRPDLAFEALENHELPLADGVAGVVLVPEAAPFLADPAWMSEIRRVLAPGGLCLMAVPNGDLEEPEPDAVAYYDLLEALEGIFPAVSMVAQTPLLAFSFVDFVAPAEDLELSLDASLAEDMVEDVAYYVALCAAEPVEPSLFAITQVPFAPVARRLQALLEDGPVDQLELAELRDALTAEREERIRLGEHTESMRRDLVESQSFAGQLRAGLSVLQEERASLEARCDTLQEGLERSLREGQARAAHEALLVEARESLTAARGEIVRLQDEQARLHQDREAHRAAAQQAQDTVEALRQEVSRRQEKIIELEQAQAVSQVLAGQLEELRAALGAARERLEGLDRELREAQEEALSLQADKAAAQQVVASLQAEQAAARQVATSLQADKTAAQHAAAAEHEALQSLASELSLRTREKEELAARSSALEASLAEALGRSLALEAELAGQSRGRFEAEDALAQSRSAGSAHKERLAELEGALSEGEKCRGVLEAELSRAREEGEVERGRSADLERRLGEVEWRRGELEALLDQARGAAETTRNDLQALQIEHRSAQGKLGSLESELSEWTSRVSGLERELDASRADQRSLEVRLQQALTATASSERQVEAHRSKSETLSAQLDQLRSEMTHSLTTQESAANAIRFELDAAREERRKAEGEAGDVQRQWDLAVAAALAREAALRNEMEDARQRTERLEGLLGEARRAGEEQGRRAAELEGLLGEARRAGEEQGRRIAELEGLLGEARRAGEEQGRRIAELEWYLGEARQAAKEKGQRAAELEGLLGDARLAGEEQGQRAAELEGLLGEAGRERAALLGRSAEIEGALAQCLQEAERAQQREVELAGAIDQAKREAVQVTQVHAEQLYTAHQELAAAHAREQGLAREMHDLGARVEAGLVRAGALEDALRQARDVAAAATVSRREASRQLDVSAAARARLEAALSEAHREVSTLQTQGEERRLEAYRLGVALEAAERALAERAAGDVSALEAALAEEQATRQEVERNLEGLEASLTELTRLGDMAIGELDAARQEAASHAAEAESWRGRCEELRTQLDQQRSSDLGKDAASDTELQALRERLQRTQAERLAAEAEKARLQRLARNASGQKEQLADAREAARVVQDQATAGMALVIGRLEAERERADALEREAVHLRGQLRDRTDRIVLLTREAAAEADRARTARRELTMARERLARLDVRTAALEPGAQEPETTPPAPASADSSLEVESLAARLEEKASACALAEGRVRALEQELEHRAAELQELQRGQGPAQARTLAMEAEWRVAGWDRAILEDGLESLRKERDSLFAQMKALELDLEEARARQEHQQRRIEELREGALRHRREMADREVALAEQLAWNEELAGELATLRDALAHQEEDREALGRQLAVVDDRSKMLAAERARLQGELEQCERQLASVHGELPSAGALEPGLSAELDRRASRIEDLEEILGVLRAERHNLKVKSERQDEELGVLRGRLLATQREGVPPARLLEARERLSALEALCLAERTRLGELASDLQRTVRQTQVIGETLAEERAAAKRISEEKALLEVRAGRALELELELDTLRSKPSLAPRDLLVQLGALQKQAEDQCAATEQSRERIRALNNVIGDREAEVLLLNAQVERLQRQASQLLVDVRQALREPAPAPEELRALLGRLGGGLEQLI